ncbi:MAG: NAD(P)-binding protein [Candidatus Micrarchaeales archaeon]
MIRLRAIHIVAVAIIIVIFIVSTFLVLLAGYDLPTSLLFSFLNIIGATFPPNSNMIDAESPFIFSSVALGGIAKIAFTITFTTIFYQFLSNIDIRYSLMKQKIKTISRHVIITPINGMGLELAKRLKESKIPTLFIDENKTTIKKNARRGILMLHGDPTNADILAEAHIDKALALYALYDNDIKNTFITIEARRMGKMEVISRIGRLEDIPKVERSGARRVILPEAAVGIEIGEFLLANS